VPGLQAGVFDAQGLRNVPQQVLIRRLGLLTQQQLTQIEEAVKRWFGLA
jgi:hypothetical protein